jgi:hypothetical protein
MSYTLLSPYKALQISDLEMHKTKYLVELILFYAPNSIEWRVVIKSSYQHDLSPDNNNTLSNSSNYNQWCQILFVSKYVQELDTRIKLERVHPMVTKCGMGSGLISNTEKSTKFYIK